jgi:uncharacterized protein (DUF58 family)
MSDTLTIFLIFLLLLGAVTQETFVIVIIYLGVGAIFLNRWWSSRVLKKLQYNRIFETKVFPDEIVPVKISLTNRSLLPAIWMRIQDLFPIEIADLRHFYQVITLGPRETLEVEYSLKARKRGYYAVGPMQISTGDLLGISPEVVSQGASDYLTVYPRVIPLTDPFLPSRSPMGTLRHRQPIYEDPSRPAGKREYSPGDSLRRIDWKATANTGQLQVKIFEPSIALETVIFLNLNLNEYSLRDRVDGAELAIVAAASLANWAIAKRQSAGLVTNGVDILAPHNDSVVIPARKGRAHMMRILESLARIKSLETQSLPTLLRKYRPGLPWGTTIVLITGTVDDALFEEVLQSNRAGMSTVVLLCGRFTMAQEARTRGKTIGVPVWDLQDEDGFKAWQK